MVVVVVEGGRHPSHFSTTDQIPLGGLQGLKWGSGEVGYLWLSGECCQDPGEMEKLFVKAALTKGCRGRDEVDGGR